MADRFPLILNTSANQIQEIASGDSLDLTGSNVKGVGILTASNVTIGAATTDLVVNGDARITGILTIGTSSLKLDGPNNLVTVGTALTLGHTQGLQFHTQNLHSEGFEINQINLSGIATFNEARFANSKRLKFGDDIDLQIYHFPAGSGNNYISAANNTGIVVSAQNVSLMNQSHSAYFFKGEAAGSIVYHNNTARVTTTSTGINITGNNNVSGDLDVDGHTNLDNVSIAGVTTFAGASTINNLLYVKGAENTDGILAIYADEGDDNNDMWRLRAGANAAFYIDNYANGAWQTNLSATATSTQLYSAGYTKVNTTTNGINVYNGESGGTTTINVTKGSGDAEVVCQRTGGSGVKLRGSHPASFLETTTDSDLYVRRNTSTRIALGSNGNTIYGTTTFQNGITGTTASFSGNVSIGGVLTYEDVTNVDSVGIITARDNIRIITDSKKLEIGAGQDLELFHNGSNTFIRNNTGYMVISSENESTYYDANNHYFRKADSSEFMAKFLQDGAVELYHNNLKKFETTSSGANVTGQLVADNGLKVPDGKHVTLGTDNDLRLYFDGSNAAWNNQVGNSYFYGGGGNFYIRPVNAEQAVNIMANGAVELFHDNQKKLETTSSGVTVTGAIVSSQYGSLGNASGVFGRIRVGADVYGNTIKVVLDQNMNLTAHNSIAFNLGAATNGSDAGSSVCVIVSDAFRPTSNNTKDLGTTAYRWRNIYTNDLNLSNKGKTNDVDNTWGDYTIQEGESDLFLINNRSGKKYKFNLTEVS